MENLLVNLALGGVGVYLLYRGATLLIDSATDLAKNVGVPIVVIGVTIVAFGTSLPELVVGLVAASDGNSDIVLGNILGSNMANLGLVLGIAALLRPVKVPLTDRFEVFSMIFATSALFFLVHDGTLGRIDGAMLLALGIAFTFLVMRRARSEHKIEQAVELAVTLQHRRARLWNVLGALAGVALIFVGARMVVTQALGIAKLVGLSDVLVGITLVAIGTSIPEIVTTVIASIRGNSSLTVGNVVGSNVLNIFMVLGLTVLITPIHVRPTVWRYDLPILLAATVLAIRFIRKDKILGRWEGLFLLAGYTAYIVFAFLARSNASALVPAPLPT